MPLNSSGPISLGGSTAGQSIAVELTLSPTGTISLNQANVRTLANVLSGAITMPTDFWGKSNTQNWGIIQSDLFYQSTTPYFPYQFFTNNSTNNTQSSYSWTVPTGVTAINAVCCGGGGGRGGGGQGSGLGSARGGGGGGGGALSYLNGISVTPGETLTIIAGSNGTLGANGGGISTTGVAGSNGGVSQIKRGATVLLTANGGSGGGAGNPTTPGAGGAGGSTSGAVAGSTTFSGGAGFAGRALTGGSSNQTSAGGNGGGAPSYSANGVPGVTGGGSSFGPTNNVGTGWSNALSATFTPSLFKNNGGQGVGTLAVSTGVFISWTTFTQSGVTFSSSFNPIYNPILPVASKPNYYTVALMQVPTSLGMINALSVVPSYTTEFVVQLCGGGAGGGSGGSVAATNGTACTLNVGGSIALTAGGGIAGTPSGAGAGGTASATGTTAVLSAGNAGSGQVGGAIPTGNSSPTSAANGAGGSASTGNAGGGGAFLTKAFTLAEAPVGTSLSYPTTPNGGVYSYNTISVPFGSNGETGAIIFYWR